METGYFIGVSSREQAMADARQGTLDFIVPQTLASLGPLHGYASAARRDRMVSILRALPGEA
jgi:hypothetical protein